MVVLQMCVQVFVCPRASFPCGIHLGVELLHHTVSLCSPLEEELSYFTKELNCFTFPPATNEVLVSPHLWQHWVIIFYYSHTSAYEAVSPYSFDLNFCDG